MTQDPTRHNFDQMAAAFAVPLPNAPATDVRALAAGFGKREATGLLDIAAWPGKRFPFRPATMAKLEKTGLTQRLMGICSERPDYTITPLGRAVAAVLREGGA